VFNELRDIPPGTGPYMYRPGSSWKTGESITLFRNPLSWYKRERPWTYNLDALQWRIVKDQVAQNEEFRKQGIDVIVVSHDAWEDNLSKDPEINRVANHFIYDHMGLGFYFIAWNTRVEPFNDKRVRQAMTMITDRKTILDEFFRGKGHIATCMAKRTYPEYSLDIEPWPFDIDRARALLAEAGWKDSNGDGILDRDGKDLAFEFKYPTGIPMYRRLAALLRDSCTRAGIRMTEQPLEWSVFLTHYLDQQFQAVSLYNSFGEPWNDPYESWHSSEDKPRGNNHVGWRHPELDGILEGMRLEFDDEKRAALFHRFNKLVHEEQPYSLLVHSEVGVLLNKRFKNVTIRPTGMQMLDFYVETKDQKYR
jgi:peptide/nickel transport system substrate-binding protein